MITAITVGQTVVEQADSAKQYSRRAPITIDARNLVAPGRIVSGQTASILIPWGGSFRLMAAKWGIPDPQTRKPIFYCHGEGQNHAYRGLLLASEFESEFDDGDGPQRIRFSSPSVSMNIGVVFRPESPNGGLSFNIMLCRAGGDMAPYNPYQPVLMPDRYCDDFLNYQKNTIFIQKAGVGGKLLSEIAGRTASVSDFARDPFKNFERDARHTTPLAYEIPKNVKLR